MEIDESAQPIQVNTVQNSGEEHKCPKCIFRKIHSGLGAALVYYKKIMSQLWQEGNELRSNNFQYEPLTPKTDVKLGEYQKVLDYVFQTDSIKNIAIAGGYASGKSSVLQSYREKNKDRNLLFISLPNFEKNAENDNGQGDNKDQNDSKQPLTAQKKSTDIEKKIIYQLAHQIHPSNIPLSPFRVKYERSRLRTMLYASATVIFILCLLCLLFPERTSTMLAPIQKWSSSPLWQVILNPTLFSWVGVVYPCIFLFYVIYRSIRYRLHWLSHNKIAVKAAGMEVIHEKKETSFFEQNFAEIVYLFANCEASAVVFEDIDRFDVNYIFKRLREFNSAVNNLPQGLKKRKTPLRFFYLLRDDIFESDGRVKFFDMIIPVVPVVGVTNSFKEFDKFFGLVDANTPVKSNAHIYPTKHLLYNASLYITDKRLLTNICNEYKFYYEKLIENTNSKPSEDTANGLFAMVVYKHFFPKDVIEQYKGRGFLNYVFKQRDELIAHITHEANQNISKLQEELSYAKQVWHKNIAELICPYMTIPSQINVTKTSGSRDYSTTDPKARVDLVYDWLKDRSQFQSIFIPGRGNWDIQKEVVSAIQAAGQERFNVYKEFGENAVSIIEKKISELTSLNFKAAQKPIKEILEKCEDHEISPLSSKHEFKGKNKDLKKEIQNSQAFGLVRFLLLNGYLREDCLEFISKPGDLSTADLEFIKSFHNAESLDETYKLDKTENIILRLRNEDYELPCILNMDLLAFLLARPTATASSNGPSNLETFLKTLVREKKHNFIITFFKEDRCTKEFLKELFARHPEQWQEVYQVASSSKEEDSTTSVQEKLAVATLGCCSREDLININEGGALANALSKSHFLLTSNNFQPEQLEVIHSKLKALDVIIEQFNTTTELNGLQQLIYENRRYALTLDNINYVLEQLGEKEADIASKNYTCICKQAKTDEGKHLSAYVEASIAVYLDLLLKDEKAIFNDDEACVVKLLDNIEVNEQLKIAYVEKCATRLNKASAIKEESAIPLVDALLENRAIAHNGSNLLTLFQWKNQTLDENIIGYINDLDTINAYQIGMMDTGMYSTMVAMGEAILISDEVNNNIYERILHATTTLRNFLPESIKDDKKNILIRSGLIFLAPDNHHATPPTYENAIKILDYAKSMPEKDYVKFIKENNEMFMDAIIKHPEKTSVYLLFNRWLQAIGEKNCIELFGYISEPAQESEETTLPSNLWEFIATRKLISTSNFAQLLIYFNNSIIMEHREHALECITNTLNYFYEQGTTLDFDIMEYLFESNDILNKNLDTCLLALARSIASDIKFTEENVTEFLAKIPDERWHNILKTDPFITETLSDEGALSLYTILNSKGWIAQKTEQQ